MTPNPPNRKSPLKPYAEIRAAFSASRREQLQMQGPVITRLAIRNLEKSRKYARSPASAAKRG